MKKLIVIALSVMMIFAFTACSGNNAGEKTATLGDLYDAATEGRASAEKTDGDNTVTIKNKEAFEATGHKKYAGYGAEVTMDGTVESWAVSTTVTLPSEPKEGYKVDLWTDSAFEEGDTQYRTDANIEAYFDGTNWVWSRWSENGDPIGPESNWIYLGAIEAVDSNKYDLEIAYNDATEQFSYRINGKLVGLVGSDPNIDNSKLERIFLLVGGPVGETVTATFTDPVVTYFASTAE